MHLNSCCVLFLLALVACQAAPSTTAIENISEAETTFNKNDIQLEDAGVEKDRAKKSTTFCVEVRSGKPEQVPCKQEVRPEAYIQQVPSKPVFIVQPVPVPAPSPFEVPKIPVQREPQVAPQYIERVPAPVPVQAPASVPIINIVPQASAPAPCDKPTVVQTQQPQQVHTIHHVIHPQTPRPSVTFINQEIKPNKEEIKVPKIPSKPQPLPIPRPSINFIPQRPKCQRCKGVIPAPQSMNFVVQPSPAAFVSVFPHNEPDKCQDEDSYTCNCRSENIIPTLTPYITSQFSKNPYQPRAMMYPNDAAFESPMPDLTSMLSRENNPKTISNQHMFSPVDQHMMMPADHRIMMSAADQHLMIPADGARQAEGRHKKQYGPLNLSVQFPVVYPGSNNPPKYYEPAYHPAYQPVYQPVYTPRNPNVYSYASSYPYGSYGTYGTYEASYPESYDSQASGTSSITVNAGGPFYRESQHTDSSSQMNEIETLPREALPTVTEMVDASNNKKRETDTQLENEQEEKKNDIKEIS